MSINTKYQTGVIWQDFQHRQLIDLFARIKTTGSGQPDRELYNYTLAFLAMYVNHHFSLEDEYMKKFSYPGRDAHNREHRSFIKQVRAFREEYKTYSPEAANDLVNQMEQWIKNHILADDQELGRHILEHTGLEIYDKE